MIFVIVSLYFPCSGYSAYFYSILQVPSAPDVSKTASDPNSDQTSAPENTPPTAEISEGVSNSGDDQIMNATSSTDIELHKTSKPSKQIRTGSLHPGLLSQNTRSLLMGKKLDSATSEETKAEKKDEDFLDTLKPPYTVQMTSGKAVFKDLYIPPPPLPDISHVTTPSVSFATSEDSVASVTSKSRPGSRQQGTGSPTQQVTPQTSKGAVWSVATTAVKLKKSSEKIKAERERLLNPKREKHALPGLWSGMWSSGNRLLAVIKL